MHSCTMKSKTGAASHKPSTSNKVVVLYLLDYIQYNYKYLCARPIPNVLLMLKSDRKDCDTGCILISMNLSFGVIVRNVWKIQTSRSFFFLWIYNLSHLLFCWFWGMAVLRSAGEAKVASSNWGVWWTSRCRCTADSMDLLIVYYVKDVRWWPRPQRDIVLPFIPCKNGKWKFC